MSAAATPRLMLRFSAFPAGQGKMEEVEYEESLPSMRDSASGSSRSPASFEMPAEIPQPEPEHQTGLKSIRLILKPKKRGAQEIEEENISEPPPTRKRQRRRSKVGKPNKRGYNDSSSDENYIQSGFKTLSGRTVVNPNAHKETAILESHGTSPQFSEASASDEPEASCMVCTRTPDSPEDQIVFCDGCDQAYHQYCHVPIIDNSFVQMAEKNWYCKNCEPGKGSQTDLNPASLPITGAGGLLLSQDEKLLYLNSLSREKLISIILNIDQNSPNISVYPTDIYKNIKQLETHATLKTETLEDTNIPGEKEPNSQIQDKSNEDDSLWQDDSDNPAISHRIYSISGVKVDNPKGWISFREFRNRDNDTPNRTNQSGV
ncbi:hypothetical protein H072_4426 [Dactylellina haptotyla CBS 200.50]|uniref:PHD-type domain-containing protein n=1 Tax=Dactylellina haptotyla (strain CBS 200.50) TaxID=1284197 RepID=S8AKJ7_DACHA|nr:hypothetical protein H072_4426 [Dactylellina haptotyla CBS 200.50]